MLEGYLMESKRSPEQFKEKILKIFEDTKTTTPQAIADKLGVSWNTADRYIKELIKEGILKCSKVGGHNLIVKNKEAKECHKH